MKKVSTYFFTAVFLALGSVLLAQTPVVPRSLDLSAGYTFGLYNSGIEFGIQSRENWGPTAGFWSRLVKQDLDPALGLIINQYAWELQPYAAWSWAPGPMVLGLGLFLSLESYVLDERILDPSHAIDSSYSAHSLRFDLGVHAQASWYLAQPWGLASGLHISITEPRRSQVYLSAAYALPLVNISE